MNSRKEKRGKKKEKEQGGWKEGARNERRKETRGRKEIGERSK